MTNPEFHSVLEKQFETCRLLLGTKEAEYDKDESDRLAFFKETAAFTGDNAKTALVYMMLKHVKSIADMAKTDSKDYCKWIEKISDNINYLMLLRAIVEEEKINGTNLDK